MSFNPITINPVLRDKLMEKIEEANEQNTDTVGRLKIRKRK